MVKSTIGPYFRKKELTLKELEARHIQQFYTEKLKTVTPNSVIHYHAVIYQALKYAMKTDMVPQNVAMKVDRPRKNSFQPTFLDAEQMQKLFEVVKGTRLELPVLVAAFWKPKTDTLGFTNLPPGKPKGTRNNSFGRCLSYRLPGCLSRRTAPPSAAP